MLLNLSDVALRTAGIGYYKNIQTRGIL